LDIAVFNWKDWMHPLAGGAEEFTRQVATAWSRMGHRVRLYTSRVSDRPAEEEVDGVEIIRRGSPLTVYSRSREAYLQREKPEVVVDEINTRPFHTHKFAGRPTVALIHQLAREFWFLELPYPAAWIGYHLLEFRWLKPYRSIPTATVSPSTAQDLRALGFKKVSIVPEGCSVKPRSTIPQKEERPTLIFLGRLTRSKRPDHALEAFGIVRRSLPESQFWVIGEGYMRGRLVRNSPEGVTFLGRLSQEEKERAMARGHLLLMPGVREGWGLAVNEANALGVPVVAYRVPGLRDSVKDGLTGLLTEPNPRAMADAALSLLSDQARWRAAAEAAMEDARNYSWDRTAHSLMAVLRGATTGVG
jgi:glycosyltransferase involved in cell wall biosynthesis